jgi:hypothetical protein
VSFDDKKNLARTMIAVAPGPSSSGLVLTLAAGGGEIMPAAPFEATVWPPNAAPELANAEIVSVESVAGDAVTLGGRGQGGTTAKQIQAGWQFASSITAKSFTDIEAAVTALSTGITNAITTAEGASDAAGTAAADVAAERDEREGADALLVPLSQKGAHNGVASLDGSGLLPIGQLPAPNAGGHYEQTFGDSTHSSFTITHNLKTLTPDITVVNQSTGLEEGCRKKVVDENTVELAATGWEATPPGVAAYRVSIDASSGLVSTNGTVLTSYAQKAEVGANSGIAPLDSTGLLPAGRLPGSVIGGSVVYKTLVGEPGQLITGAITRSAAGAALEAPVTWPDGATGVYKGVESVTVPGAIDSYTITHVEGETVHTYTQAAVTRNSEGAITNRPAITYA